MIHGPCGKFGICSFSRFDSVVRTDTRTHTQTDADERHTPATLVGVSKYTYFVATATSTIRRRAFYDHAVQL